MKNILFLCLLIFLVSCNKNKKYVEEAIEIIENNSIRKDSINWNSFKSNLLEEIKKEDDLTELHALISKALYGLGDNHSFLLTKDVQAKIFNDRNPIPRVYSDTISDKIGYIKIPQFLGNDRQVNQFANDIQDEIKWLDSYDLNNYIIDLRGNTGGNMFPMYLGLAPILGTDVSGFFKMTNDKLLPWSYKSNSVFVGDEKMLEIEDSYSLKSDIHKIAVLIDGETGSSGEAIAIAFKGMKNTKFFGQSTYGISTGNDVFVLSDGTKMVLTTSIFVDRNKKIYGGKVEPDAITYQPKKEAIEWLLNTNTNK
ncbi:peptidase S41-like protein [Lutibacter sp. Hel_I_33_5]|uniref:S41 family peptidase n=1 Tax=Lutibacter sp. Hel_I_33_5 TaxID=1566289 RepID=UPI0011A8C0BA|nr:S41 family peptidase [Lutibacter sp. Hel_I_33_5]TVZ56893.1 peptidase S41-like protein [Lutibacter sp. Hel_I_33_5]